jgi:hypothetical protein
MEGRSGARPVRIPPGGLLCLLGGLLLRTAGCGEVSPPSGGVRVPRLVDVTEAAGLPTYGMTSGAVLVDLDRDGRLDLLIGRHDNVPEAYRNLGGLRFASMPGWGSQMTVSDHHATLADDLDGDGLPDLYFVAGAHRGEGVGNNALYLSSKDHAGDAAQRWGVQDPYGRGRGALLLDVLGNRERDLLVLNWRTAPRAYSLRQPPPMQDREAEILGYPAADDEAVVRALARGEPPGQARRRDEHIRRLWPRDLDGDGRADFLALGVPPVRIVRADADGVHPDPAALPPDVGLPAPVDAAWGDLDDDGHPDLYLVYGFEDEPSHFARRRGNRLLFWRDGRFTAAGDSLPGLGGSGVVTAAVDLDNNGALDLVVLQASRQRLRSRLRILLNGGRGRFVQPEGIPLVTAEVAGVADAILAADLDEDGDVDLLALLGAIGPDDAGGGVRLYRNDLESRHWLQLVLEPRQPALPYGARVELIAGHRRQVRQFWPCEVSGSAFRVSLHFGLGAAGSIERLTVTWPSGATTTLRGVAADRRLVLRQP